MMLVESSWQTRSIRLKYAVGDVRLFSLTFPAVVRTAQWLTPGDGPAAALPFTACPEGIEAAVVRSHPVRQALPRCTIVDGFIRYVPYRSERYYIDLRGTFNEYLNTFSGKTRATLLRKVRRFADRSGGAIQWREFRTSRDMEQFRTLGREVSRKTYQERLHRAGLPDSDAFWDRARAQAEADAIRGYVLMTDDRPIAYLLCPIVEGRVIYEHLGYDPEFGSWSPGTVLQFLAVERLFDERRYVCFDFTEGGGEHKKLFATGNAVCSDVYYFRRTWRNRTAVLVHRQIDDCSTALGTALERAGLKTIVRRLIRGHESLREIVRTTVVRRVLDL